jgi:hypothetical protein
MAAARSSALPGRCWAAEACKEVAAPGLPSLPKNLCSGGMQDMRLAALPPGVSDHADKYSMKTHVA